MASPREPIQRSIPLARPDIGAREIDLVTQALQSDILAMGPFTQRFEAGIAAVAARREGVACSSGTAGLHLGVRALDIGEGDEVITTPFSFVASANCLLYERAIPRFVDIEEDSLGLDPELIERVATARTKAVLPVHVFGRPCRIEAIVDVARQRGWSTIEDACEGLGSTVGGRPLGNFGDVAVFAFYPNKQITTGEGGMVVTDDAALAETMRSLRNQVGMLTGPGFVTFAWATTTGSTRCRPPSGWRSSNGSRSSALDALASRRPTNPCSVTAIGCAFLEPETERRLTGSSTSSGSTSRSIATG